MVALLPLLAAVAVNTLPAAPLKLIDCHQAGALCGAAASPYRLSEDDAPPADLKSAAVADTGMRCNLGADRCTSSGHPIWRAGEDPADTLRGGAGS